ncbi:MAG TPA: type II toxin-antitoxin system VapC family toxin [Pseudomonadales bacterium]
MIIMLASDICRTILRQQPPALLSRLQQWSSSSDEVVVSAITYAELVAAALLTADKDRHMRLVEEFCARLDAVVSWDSGAVDAYTGLQRQLMLEQRALNMNDVMIAAHALSLKARLLTSSEKSFKGMAGLDLQLWPLA